MTNEQSNGPARLDIGCGEAKLPGYLGMDGFASPKVDVVHDFDVFPYPFADSSFDEVKMYNSLEHATDFIATVCEVHRILRPGGMLKVLCPHYSGPDAYRDPTHRTFFAHTTFDRFTGKTSYSTGHAGMFRMHRQMFGVPQGGSRGPTALVKAFANRFPDLYERYLCWMMPAKAIYYELEAIKPETPA
jgi:SAM-dependent methyltransferase